MSKAVLFDMDGVLTDSEPVILEASILGLREYGINPVKEDFQPFIGAGEDRFIGGVAEKHGLTFELSMKKRVYEIYLEIVDGLIGKFENVPETLSQLRKNGYLIGLASSADNIKIDANLKAAGIDKSLFDCIVSGEDVINKKPAPDIYIKTARILDVAPDDCVVVEDALNGVKAAVSAGMKCIGVCTTFSSFELTQAGAIITIDNVSKIQEAMRGI